MEIDGKKISNVILKHLQKSVKESIKQKEIKSPRLVIFSVKPTEDTLSFMRSKEKAVRKIGGRIKLITYKRTPRFEDFANKVSEVANNKDTHAVIIQQPLPASLSTVSLFDYIPLEKEIEGFKKKTPYEHPIGLAVLTALKKIYSPEPGKDFEDIMVNIERDTMLFKQIFKRKRVVVIGRGKTGGQPIGNTLTKVKLNYINLNSQTTSFDMFLKAADVVISAVGQKIIHPEQLKQGATVISVGMHKHKKKWYGDYDVPEIKSSVLAYTPTPNGIGPLNVAYLMYNLVQAWRKQHKLNAKI